MMKGRVITKTLSPKPQTLNPPAEGGTAESNAPRGYLAGRRDLVIMEKKMETTVGFRV